MQTRCARPCAHADGTSETIASSWIAGTDGSHSTVRALTGQKLEGSFKGERFLLGDVDADYDLTARPCTRSSRPVPARCWCSRCWASGCGSSPRSPTATTDVDARAAAAGDRPSGRAGITLRSLRAGSRSSRSTTPRCRTTGSAGRFLAGRRRPCAQPGRRPGHEHRDAGRLQPGLEAGAVAAQGDAAPGLWTATTPSGTRSPRG